jgi:hypothetical protein
MHSHFLLQKFIHEIYILLPRPEYGLYAPTSKAVSVSKTYQYPAHFTSQTRRIISPGILLPITWTKRSRFIMMISILCDKYRGFLQLEQCKMEHSTGSATNGILHHTEQVFYTASTPGLPTKCNYTKPYKAAYLNWNITTYNTLCESLLLSQSTNNKPLPTIQTFITVFPRSHHWAQFQSISSKMLRMNQLPCTFSNKLFHSTT